VAAHDVAHGVVKIFLATSLRGGGSKRPHDDHSKGSGLRRKLPSPPPLPNVHERPPTPPSVPGAPPQPPTPPLPPRLLAENRPRDDSKSECTLTSETTDGETQAPPESFQQVLDLVGDDFDRALTTLALDFWMRFPHIDWDGDISGVTDLRMGTLSLLEWNFLGLDAHCPTLVTDEA